MNKVDTGSNTIFRFDDVLDSDTCDQICQFVLAKPAPDTIDGNLRPWHQGETFLWHNLPDLTLQKKIFDYRTRVEQLVRETYGITVYNEFTDIVTWRTGRSMGRHKDDGYEVNDILQRRKFSSVTYLNDDYQGGETFINTEQGNDYISVPKKGSMVCYYSDPRNEHGVNLITSGVRVTMPIWYCLDEQDSENVRLKNIIDKLK